MAGVLDVLREQESRARASLAADVVGYFASGAGDESALADAAPAWQRYRLRPRVLRDVSSVSLRSAMLGVELAHPVLLAPTAAHGLAHPDGEVATAAGAAGALMVVSWRASRTIEDIAAVGIPWWLQVYVMRERSVTAAFVRRAVASGAGALVLTGDTPYVGRKRWPLPLAGSALSNLGRHLAADRDPVEALEQDPGIDLEMIAWLADISGLPVLVKGVLRGDDARACLDAGAAGVIVSNHGGRQVGRAVSTARALPEVVAAAGGAPVLVDGGLRSGPDIVVALALGASAVLLGRPVLWALGADGADGVRTMLDAVLDDVAFTLALLGVRSLAELDASYVTAG